MWYIYYDINFPYRRVWFQKDTNQCRSVQWRYKLFVKSTQDVDIWMEIPIQHDVQATEGC
jgi:hypothetical protein